MGMSKLLYSYAWKSPSLTSRQGTIHSQQSLQQPHKATRLSDHTTTSRQTKEISWNVSRSVTSHAEKGQKTFQQNKCRHVDKMKQKVAVWLTPT